MAVHDKFKAVGLDLIIDSNANIKRPHLVEIGNHVAIDQIYCSTAMKLGDYVHIAQNVCIIGGIDAILIMGNFSGISANSTIVCASANWNGGGLMNPQIPKKYQTIINLPVIFEDYACVAVNCVVMPGVKLAIGSVLGANSLLTESTEPWTIYVGSPARPIKKRDNELMLRYAKELGY